MDTSIQSQYRQLTELICEFCRDRYPEARVEVTSTSPHAAPSISIDGTKIDLENLRLEIAEQQFKDKPEVTIESYLSKFLDSDPEYEIAHNSWEYAETKIFPLIKPDSYFHGSDPDRTAHVEFLDGLSVIFVIDTPSSMASITVETMKQWGKTVEDLRQAAEKNLDSLIGDEPLLQTYSSEGAKMIVLTEDDGYGAARVLSQKFQKKLRHAFGGDCVVAIPTRDYMFAMEKHPTFLARFRAEKVEPMTRSKPHAITSQYLLVVNDGIALYHAPQKADSLGFVALHRRCCIGWSR